MGHIIITAKITNSAPRSRTATVSESQSNSAIDSDQHNQSWPADSECGLSCFSFLLMSTGVLAWYIKIGYPLFTAGLPQVYHFLALALLTLACIFAFGCCLHMFFIGAPSTGRLSSQMRVELDYINSLTSEVAKQIEKFEFIWCDNRSILGPTAKQTLSAIRRIYLALDQRQLEVYFLASSRSSQAQLEAWEILSSPLIVDGNVVRTLIDSEPIRPIPRDELEPKLNKLFNTLEIDLQREETVRRSKQLSTAHYLESLDRTYALEYNPAKMQNQQLPYYG